MSLYLIADLWTHCQELSLATLPLLLSWACAPHRCVDPSLLGCGCLGPPLLVVPRLMFFHPHLSVCSGPEPCTIHKHRRHEHTPVHAHVRGTGTEPEQRTHVSVPEEPVVHTKYRDFHSSYGKVPILIFKCEIQRSPTL